MGQLLHRSMCMTPPLGRTDAPEDVASPTPGASTDEELDRMVGTHLPLVHHLVRETLTRVPSHVAADDLVSAGMMALAQAARSFDTGRGVKFSTFASARIRGAILDELRSLDWASRSVRRRARQLDSAREALTSQEGREATEEEVAERTGLSVEEVRANQEAVVQASVLSLQGFGEATLDEVVPGRGPSPEELLETRERSALLADAVACLPYRLRTVVEDYFFDERPMSEIAAKLGVTESRVSQIRAEALERLRGALEHALEGAARRRPAPPASGSAGSGVAERRRQAYYAEVVSLRSVAERLTGVG